MYSIGVDIGSTCAKVAVLDQAGKLLYLSLIHISDVFQRRKGRIAHALRNAGIDGPSHIGAVPSVCGNVAELSGIFRQFIAAHPRQDRHKFPTGDLCFRRKSSSRRSLHQTCLRQAVDIFRRPMAARYVAKGELLRWDLLKYHLDGTGLFQILVGVGRNRTQAFAIYDHVLYLITAIRLEG